MPIKFTDWKNLEDDPNIKIQPNKQLFIWLTFKYRETLLSYISELIYYSKKTFQKHLFYMKEILQYSFFSYLLQKMITILTTKTYQRSMKKEKSAQLVPQNNYIQITKNYSEVEIKGKFAEVYFKTTIQLFQQTHMLFLVEVFRYTDELTQF